MHQLAFLEVYMIRVMVNGAGGKMGREVELIMLPLVQRLMEGKKIE